MRISYLVSLHFMWCAHLIVYFIHMVSCGAESTKTPLEEQNGNSFQVDAPQKSTRDRPEIFFVVKSYDSWPATRPISSDCDVVSVLLSCGRLGHGSGRWLESSAKTDTTATSCADVRKCISKASVHCQRGVNKRKRRHKSGGGRGEHVHDVTSLTETCVNRIKDCMRNSVVTSSGCHKRLDTCLRENLEFCPLGKLNTASHKTLRPLLMELRAMKS